MNYSFDLESELVALATIDKEAEWLKNLLVDIELWQQPMPVISLHCDSQTRAIFIMVNPNILF